MRRADSSSGLLPIGAHDAHAAKVWVISAERSPVSCSDLVVDFRILRRWRPSRNQANGMNSRIMNGKARIHVEHGGDEDDHLEIVLAERDDASGSPSGGSDWRR